MLPLSCSPGRYAKIRNIVGFSGLCWTRGPDWARGPEIDPTHYSPASALLTWLCCRSFWQSFSTEATPRRRARTSEHRDWEHKDRKRGCFRTVSKQVSLT